MAEHLAQVLTRAGAEELLYREALLIDTRRYDEWLAMFTPDIEFWMPAWRNETEPTSDPDRELSLIYYKGRRNLDDRRGLYRLNTAATRGSCGKQRAVDGGGRGHGRGKRGVYLPSLRRADESDGVLLWAL